MFSTIRRHQSWLWWVVGGITIASFLVFGPSSCNQMERNRREGGGGSIGTIGGRAIRQEEMNQAVREVSLRYYLTTQQWPDDKSKINLTREALFRLFLIEKQKEFGVTVSPETMAELARRILGTASLDDFANQILKPQHLTADDFERFLRHESGNHQLIMTAGLNGKLVPPQEAETLYRSEHQELACTAVLLSVTNYLSSVKVTNDALLQFYTNRMAAYIEPARVQVNYVKFNVTNYWPAAVKSLTNLDLMVTETVKKYGTNLFRRAKTQEESRAAIKDAIIREEAKKTARRDAGEFAEELYQMKPKQAENLETLAKKKNLPTLITEPFDQENGPKDLDVLLSFSHAAFELSADEPFSGSVVAEDGVYVLGLKRQIPSAAPSFKAVEAKVTEDYRLFEASLLLKLATMSYYNSLSNGLAHGKTFTALAAEQGLKTESLPPISLSTTSLPESLESRYNLASLRQAAFTTPVGNVSPPARAPDGAYFVYVEKKLPLDEIKMKAELPGFLAYMRQARQNDAFNQWFLSQVGQDKEFAQLVQRVSQENQVRSGARRPQN